MDLLHHHLLLLAITTFSLLPCFTTSQNDTASLLKFLSETDPHGNLLSNWSSSSSSNACCSNWVGVNCSIQNRVTSLSLSNFNLRGAITSLSNLDQLRHLNLNNNRFNGSISPLSSCLNLKHIYLKNNDFSGEIPLGFGKLRRIIRLDISDNNLQGHIPVSLSNSIRVITFRAENNALTGHVPDFTKTLTRMKQFNLSNNELVGRVPIGLIHRFGVDSFLGNKGLCVLNCSMIKEDEATVFSTPENVWDKPGKSSSHGAIIALVVTNSVLVSIIVLLYCCMKCGSGVENVGELEGENGKRKSNHRSENSDDGTSGSDKSKLVFFDRRKNFELEDLLRASAEMLGKGSLGTVYRAVLDDGNMVAVKRLKDANPCGRKEFEQYMDVIGRLKHPNIVKLRAYYYAREEKLLVYDYLANGSLHSLLHGNRGPGRIPLDWTTRISLVLGAARGLARIHSEYSATKVPHGNVKSSNVLLDKNGVACIADFGLALLLNPAHAIARLGGYKPPEQSETKRLSQEADVYSFGVLLLEVLTGKAPTQFPNPTLPKNIPDPDEQPTDLPKWVRSVVRDEWTAEVFDPELLRYKNIEEELVAMLHVAMACVAPQPEKRPTMMDVAKMIEEIRVEESPIGEDYDDSRNSLSPSIPTTEEGVANY